MSPSFDSSPRSPYGVDGVGPARTLVFLAARAAFRANKFLRLDFFEGFVCKGIGKGIGKWIGKGVVHGFDS